MVSRRRNDRSCAWWGCSVSSAARMASTSAGVKRSWIRGYRRPSQSARMRSARFSTGSISQSVLSRSKAIARITPFFSWKSGMACMLTGTTGDLMKSWLSIALALVCSAQVWGADAPSRALTPTDLNMLARVSDPQVSPDGRYVVYVQRETDLEANRGRTDLWLLDLETANARPRRLTQHSANDTHPRWALERASIYFLSTRTGSQQIWRLPLTGGEAVQITDYPLDVTSFGFSRSGGRLAISMDVFRDCPDFKCTR